MGVGTTPSGEHGSRLREERVTEEREARLDEEKEGERGALERKRNGMCRELWGGGSATALAATVSSLVTNSGG